MSDIKKQILSRLMGLNSKSADEQLVKIAKEMLDVIKSSQDNEVIIEQLDILKEFVYKAPDEAIEIIKHIVNKTPFPPKIFKVPFEYKGKSHNDLLLKCLELVARIRYLVTEESLKLLAQLSLSKETSIRNETLRILKELTEYDYNILTKSKLGYTVQRIVLDFIINWKTEDRVNHFDFVVTATTALLSTSMGGESWNLNDDAQYTLTWYSGAITPTEFLRKIRKETIDMVYELYEYTYKPEMKKSLISVLEEATRGPINPDHYKDVSPMLSDDKDYLAGIYDKIIFDEKGNIRAPLAIIAEVDERIFWLNKNEGRKSKKLSDLRNKILADDQYHMFRLLVGHDSAYGNSDNWREVEEIRSKEIDALVDLVNEKDLDGWFQRFDNIASQQNLVEVGEFFSFNSFLFKLAKKHPKTAYFLLNKSFESNTSLLQLAEHILRGFREGKHLFLWDSFAEKIISSKDIYLINKLLFSLNLSESSDINELIREQDILLLEEITKKQGKFLYLKKDTNREFQYALFNALLRNFKHSPERVNQLVLEELVNNSNNPDIYIRELPFAIHRKWVEIKDFHTQTIEVIKKNLTVVMDLDWHVQEFMLEIGKQYGLRFISDVFTQRIAISNKRKKDKFWESTRRYEAVPFDLNDDLRLFIIEQPNYLEIVNEWVAGMSLKWSTYNFQITHLLQRLGSKFEDVVLSLVAQGDHSSLIKASHLLRQFEGSNFGLCIELVRKTQDKKILSQVKSDMYSTGVVSGEYGLADAFKDKAEALEKYREDKDENVRDFVNEMIKNFQHQSEQERLRTDEDKQLRKVEFDS